MFTPFAFIKRQVTAAIAAVAQRLLLLGNFTTFNTPVSSNAVKLINGTSQIDPTFNVGSGTNNQVYASDFDANGKLIIGGAFTSFSGSTANRIVKINENGTLDTSFNIGSGTNSTVNAIKTLASGKTLIAGNFTTYSGSRANKITRLNADGTLDATFAEVPIPYNAVGSLSIQPDNKILIAGGFISGSNGSGFFTKIKPNGDLDTTFIDDLSAYDGPSSTVNSIAAQSDGKLVIGGAFTSYLSNYQGRIVRVNADGTRDGTFTSINDFDAQVYTILTLPATKSLVGGIFSSHAGTASPYIARLNSTGSIDTTFNHPNLNNTVFSAVTQSDGRIIIGGTFTTSGVYEPDIAKLNSQLEPDVTFVQGDGANSSVFSAVTQSDGRIIIGGTFTEYSGSTANRIVRINTDGTRDTSFNIGTQGFNDTVYVVRVQSDDKILVGGGFTSYSGSSSPRIVRLNSNGTKDLTFNPGAGPTNIVYDIQLQSDGKIVAVGAFTTTYSGSTSPRIVRINPNGTKDFTFNMGTTGFSANQYSCQIQADGKIIVVGLSATYSGSAAQRIRRINTSGSLDTTFNIGTAGLNNTTYKATIQPNQKILVAGSFTSYSGSAINGIVRINENGTRDTTFNPGSGFNSVSALPSDIQLDSIGNIYVGSTFTVYSGSTVNRFVKISPSGSIITGSGTYNGFSSTVNTLLIDNTGNVYAGGNFSYIVRPTNRIARLTANGNVDPTFNIGSGFSDTVYSLAVQADDKIVVGGNVATYSGSAAARIRRLNTDGTDDTSFNQGTGFGTSNVVRVKIQPNQKILAIGGFTSYSGSTANRIARLNENGTLDTTFNTGVGFDTVTATPSALELDSSGNIYVGSNFLTYSGSTVNRFVKISPSGSIITGSGYYNGFDNTVNALYVDNTQNVHAGGAFTNYSFLYNGILRLNENGTRDTSFNIGSGTMLSTTFVGAVSINSLSANKILIGGTFTSYSGSTANRIARLNENGTLDTTFNIGNGFNDSVSNLVIDSTERIIVRGNSFTQYSGSASDGVVRINTNGTKDASFNPIGLRGDFGTTAMILDNSDTLHVLNQKQGPTSNIYKKFNSSGVLDEDSIYLTSNGGEASYFAKDSSNNIFVLGYTFSAARITNAGIIAFDNSSNNTSSLFNAGTGFFNTSYGVMSTRNAAYAEPSVNVVKSLKTTSGDIWIGLQYPNYYITTYYSGSAIFGTALNNTKTIFKINQQGNVVLTSSYQSYGDKVSFAQHPDEKLLIGLYYPGALSAIHRINSNGSYDNTFTSPYLHYGVYSMQVQSTGKILIGGDFNSNVSNEYSDGEGGYYYLDEPTSPSNFLRLNSDGTVDGTFPTVANGPVYNINTLPDDSSILTGGFQIYAGAERENIAKINANGNLDYTYNVGTGFNNTVFKSTLQPDGKLISAGEFTEYSGSTANRIVRINTDGTRDTTFNPGTGFNIFNSPSSKILVDNLGNIHIAGGGFTSYSGSAISGYVKILPTGQIDPTGTSGSFAAGNPVTMELLD